MAQSRQVLETSRQLLDLARVRLVEGLPVTGGQDLSLRVGCESCGARAAFQHVGDAAAFFAVHPYACQPDEHEAAPESRA